MEVTPTPTPVHLTVRDSSHVGEARRAASALARLHGMAETEAGAVAIVATELGNNLWRYAPGGTLSMQWLTTPGAGTLEIVATDRGPGMEDVSRCIVDGYSTGGTPGTGLGAVKRLSAEFDAYSQPGKGTVIVSRIPISQTGRDSAAAVHWAAYSKPMAGEVECGDAWCVSATADAARFFVVDGLGHGPVAAVAANAAVASFRQHPNSAPRQFLEQAHGNLSGTRGAAAAILRVEFQTGAVSYAGIGNIAACLIGSGGQKGLISHNGTLGAQARKFQAFDYVWPAGGLLVMHSDGIKTRWSLAEYPGLTMRHPAVIAAILARDSSRGTDDVTVVVARRGQ